MFMSQMAGFAGFSGLRVADGRRVHKTVYNRLKVRLRGVSRAFSVYKGAAAGVARVAGGATQGRHRGDTDATGATGWRVCQIEKYGVFPPVST